MPSIRSWSADWARSVSEPWSTATYRGARVIDVDGHPYRSELALQLGCSLVVDPADPDALKKIQEATGGRGVDKSVEASGRPEAKKRDMLVTHTFPLSRVEEAWNLQVSGNCGKVILHPWEEGFGLKIGMNLLL